MGGEEIDEASGVQNVLSMESLNICGDCEACVDSGSTWSGERGVNRRADDCCDV